jgi:ABC-type phosphate transport system auxiliary subunit
MRILYGLYAKGQEFVRIRLEEKFSNAFKNNEDLYAQIREVITRQMQKINFISLPKIHNP